MKTFNGWFAASVATLALLGAATVAAGEAVTQAQIEAATTAAQHEAIALSYQEEAAAAEKKADGHAMMAKAYRNRCGKATMTSMADHCDSLAQTYRSAAVEYRLLAKEHQEMAAAAK